MIRNYLILFMTSCVMNISAQISCPVTIKTSGQSTPSSPIFTLSNGQNGCNENWPLTITVNGTITYDFVSCSGGNLKYEIESGATPPPSFEMTTDFGSGVVCSYDSSGNLVTLSNNEYELVQIKMTPNPASDKVLIITGNSIVFNKLEIYNISGQIIQETKNQNVIDISDLKTGMYFANLITNKGVITKKLIKN